MADLGQDKESLKVKLLEVKYVIEQKALAKKSIELDRARIQLKLGQYAKSISDIDKQILEEKKNLESIEAAIEKAEG